MNDERGDAVAELLKLAGPRPRPDADRTARVREAVHEEWQRAAQRRRRVRLTMVAAIAATIAGVLLFQLPQKPTGRIVEAPHGTVASIDWNGATLRLAGGARMRLESDHEATLERGTIYFASEGHAGVTIKTPFGAVRDIGTQFEIRLDAHDLRVRVREGIVDVRGTQARAGMEVVATSTEITQRAIATSGAEWAWIERAAPPITLEGRTLGNVIERAAREKGLRVEWQTSREAVLHGDVSLTPDEAIEAAIAAAGATYRIDGDTLIVSAPRASGTQDGRPAAGVTGSR